MKLTDKKVQTNLTLGAVALIALFLVARYFSSSGAERFELNALKVVGKNRDIAVGVQDMKHIKQYHWILDNHVLIQADRVGDSIEYLLPTKKAGRYRLAVEWTTAPDCAVVQVNVNGNKLGQPIDLWSSEVKASGPIVSGEFDTTDNKETKMQFVVVGRNPNNKSGYKVAIDGVRLEQIK